MYNANMVISKKGLPNFLLSVGEKIKPFFYGKCYIAIVALITAFFYCTNMPLLGLSVFSFFATIHLLFFRDLSCFIPLPIFAVLLLKDFTVFDSFAPFIVLFIPFVALVSHFILYPIKKVFVGKALIPFLCITVALLLGGIFSPYRDNYAYGLVTVLTVGPVLWFAYFLFTQYFSPPKDVDIKENVCYMFLFLGVTLMFEMLEPNVLEKFHFGWGSTNACASLLLLSIPAGWFLVFYRKRIYITLPLLLVQYVGIVLSKSDACLGISFAMTPVIFFTVLMLGKPSKQKTLLLNVILLTLGACLVVFFVALLFSLELRDFTQELLLKALNENGRSGFYKLAMSLFADHPLFGIGQGFIDTSFELRLSGVVTFNFHSTLFHVLATMGIVGIIAYTYYFYQRTRIFLSNRSSFNMLCFYSFIMLESYGMVDACEFNVVPIMMALTLLIVAVEMTAHIDLNRLPLQNIDRID